MNSSTSLSSPSPHLHFNFATIHSPHHITIAAHCSRFSGGVAARTRGLDEAASASVRDHWEGDRSARPVPLAAQELLGARAHRQQLLEGPPLTSAHAAPHCRANFQLLITIQSPVTCPRAPLLCSPALIILENAFREFCAMHQLVRVQHNVSHRVICGL